MKEGMNQRGFLMTLEVASALFLLIIAASSLALFRLPQARAQEFYVCSDAAILLSKSSASSGVNMQAQMERLGKLGRVCVSFEFGGRTYSNCENSGRQENIYSFNFPIWKGGELQNATVACWQAK